MNRSQVIVSGFFALLIVCVFITGCTNNSPAASVTTPEPTPSPTSSVPIQTTTVATTSITQSTTQITTSPTAVITPNTTVTTTTKPAIKTISPDEGNAASSVSVTNLAGNNFITGATVKLKRTGSSDIVATSVTVQSPTSITCTLPIPADAQAGTWDLVVTNPNGQSATFTNLFSVHGSTNPTATTTTQGSTGTVGITLVNPSLAMLGEYHKPLTLTGSNFKDGVKIKLISTKNPGTVIESTNSCELYSSTSMRCYVNIPTSFTGTWDVVVTNTDATTGTLSRGFEIR